MNTPLDMLRAMPVLRPIPQEDLASIPAVRVEKQKGEPFFHQGDMGDAVFGVLTGRVRVVKHSPAGREVCLELLGPGDIFAAVAVMRKLPYPATAIPAEATACVRIPGESFQWLVGRHPWLTAGVLNVVSQRLLDASQSRLSLATEPVETRIAQTLLKLADKYAEPKGEQLIFASSLTRQQLADLAGTTVETTIRVMSKWTKSDLVRSSSSRITVMRLGELQRIADGTTPRSPC